MGIGPSICAKATGLDLGILIARTSPLLYLFAPQKGILAGRLDPHLGAQKSSGPKGRGRWDTESELLASRPSSGRGPSCVHPSFSPWPLCSGLAGPVPGVSSGHVQVSFMVTKLPGSSCGAQEEMFPEPGLLNCKKKR